MNRPFDLPVDAWSRRVVAGHLERHPVDATFVGLHDHDHALPDPSVPGVQATVDAMEGWLAEEVPSAPDPFGELDRRLLRGFLASRVWEYESGWMSANPSAHVGDAVFGLMGPLLTRVGPMEERLEAVAARMGRIPGFLASVRSLMADGTSASGREGGPVAGRSVPAGWTRRAIRECRGAVRFLEEGLDRVGESTDVDEHAEAAWIGQVSALRTDAADAFRAFAHVLETDVLPGGSDEMACGPEAFDMYLRQGHFLRESAEDIVAYARDEMLRTRSWLDAHASDFDASTPEEVLARLADQHPPADGYLDRYRTTWQEMRDVALARDLVSWPDFPIEYVERPAWARAAAPDLYFLFYRSPAAFRRPAVHRYMVAPLDPGAGPEELEAFLRSNNDSVIKLNHVVHHGGIGHHVQNWHASRSPSLVGRIAAVDCASRVAMFCSGTMAEGWACYATDLMAEAGGLTELEQYAEHHGRVRMCARAIVDVELHHGRMSFAEAQAFYRDSAGMTASAAEAETVKNGMFPGAALMYLVGTDMIHELRRDLMRTLGDRFVLRDVHDAFLSYGSIPVRLVADEMRRRAEAGLPLGAHEPAEPSSHSTP